MGNQMVGSINLTEQFVELVPIVSPDTQVRDNLDLSRFDAAPLIAFIAAKETNYGNETDERIPR